LVAVHVVPHLIQPAWLGAIVSRHKADHAAHARRRLAALINRLQSPIRIDARVIAGHVADGLVSFALRERASLVVVALQGRRGSWFDRRGSIAYAVVAQAATPVLAYPAAWHPR
jgi:nucleotide-binding universal stress UspA family protein